MESAQQFREYAKECMEWAETAETEAERDTLLEMAKAWMAAALVAEAQNPSPLQMHNFN
jgi:hypothetical protein